MTEGFSIYQRCGGKLFPRLLVKSPFNQRPQNVAHAA